MPLKYLFFFFFAVVFHMNDWNRRWYTMAVDLWLAVDHPHPKKKCEGGKKKKISSVHQSDKIWLHFSPISTSQPQYSQKPCHFLWIHVLHCVLSTQQSNGVHRMYALILFHWMHNLMLTKINYMFRSHNSKVSDLTPSNFHCRFHTLSHVPH